MNINPESIQGDWSAFAVLAVMFILSVIVNVWQARRLVQYDNERNEERNRLLERAIRDEINPR